MTHIAKTAIIHPNVELGEGTIVEDFCIIGVPAPGKKEGEEKTIIGKNSHIRSHSVIFAGNHIGDNFGTGIMATVREHNRIGNNVWIGIKSSVQFQVIIEDDVNIHTQVFVPEHSHLKKGCWLGPKVCLTNAPFPKSPLAKEKLLGVTIEEHAKIGANATILPGVTIGKNALVGSGSVVTKDVAEETVVVGNPAHELKKVHELKYSTGEKAYE
jgi:acetyltransferase-like isoleucine patch superfamily enzyme